MIDEAKGSEAAPAPAVEAAAGLGHSAKQAVLWSAGLTLLRDGLQFIQMLVLTRLLDPSIYGVAAYANTLFGFLGMFSFQHVVTHVIQMRPDQKVDYEQHFTFGLVLNGAAFVLANLVALALPYFGDYRAAQPVLHVLSFSLLLSVPSELRQRMLEREHLWRHVRSLEMVALFGSVALGIGMALLGAGVFALVVPGMTFSVVLAVDLFVGAKWRPRLHWDRNEYRDALAFGANRVSANALNGGRKLFESTLIAQHFRFAALGVFSRAEGLSVMFCGRVAQQVLASLYPVITRAEPRSERFQRIAGLVLRSVMWLILPIAVFIGLQAQPIVKTVYGSKWLEVIPLLPLAAAAIAAQSFAASAYQLLLMNEERALCLRSDGVAFVLGIAAMWFGIPLGTRTYLWMSFGVFAIIAILLATLLLRTQGARGTDLWLSLGPPAIASGLGVLAANLATRALPSSGIVWFDSVIVGAVFGPAYLLSLRLIFRESLAELLAYAPAGQRVARALLWL